MGHKLDYANLMFHQLLEITNRKKQGLVYGMTLTQFFKFYDIPIDDETNIIVPTENEVYMAKTVRLMKYKLQRGQWVPNDPLDVNDDGDEDKEEEGDDDEDEGQTVTPRIPFRGFDLRNPVNHGTVRDGGL